MVSFFFFYFVRMSYLVVFLFVLNLINLAVSDGGLAVLVFRSTLVKYAVRLLMKIPWYDSYLTKSTLLTVMTN